MTTYKFITCNLLFWKMYSFIGDFLGMAVCGFLSVWPYWSKVYLSSAQK